MDAYADNRAEATAVVLEDDTVAQALRTFMAGRTEWKDKASVLLARLTETWSGRDLPEKWPKTAHALSNRIRRVVPQLASVGIAIIFPRTSDRSHARMIKVAKIDPQGEDRDPTSIQVAPPSASEASEASEANRNQVLSFLSGAPDGMSEAFDQTSEDGISSSLRSCQTPVDRTLYSGVRTLRVAGVSEKESKQLNVLDARTLSDALGGTTWKDAGGDMVCAQCGAGPRTDPPDDPPSIEETPGIWLHPECVRFWRTRTLSDAIQFSRAGDSRNDQDGNH
jgi:hypothetical protein